MVSTIHAAIQKSPFKNVYWFSRWLLNTDQFGALGKQKEAQMLELVAVLENLSAQENFSDDEKFRLMKNTLLTEIPNMTARGTKARLLALNLAQQLDKDICTVDDAIIFCVAMKYVVAPINRAMILVPSDDKKFCETAARNILDTFGEEKIDSLIATWDNLGGNVTLHPDGLPRNVPTAANHRVSRRESKIFVTLDPADVRRNITTTASHFPTCQKFCRHKLQADVARAVEAVKSSRQRHAVAFQDSGAVAFDNLRQRFIGRQNCSAR